MYQAKILNKQGVKKSEIAKILEVDRRTIYNYLNNRVFIENMTSRGRPGGSHKLAPFYRYIDEKLNDDLYLSGEILYNKLITMGYTGKTTILGDHLKRRREELQAYAVYRFETIPGEQAQVDWTEVGRVWEDGKLKKRYCFVMKLGFSRRSYMEFTTSMKQPVLFACMKRAFNYFGGVPFEILFDNMKTAFLYDYEKEQWVVNPKMVVFAVHYGFKPKRCRVRRPQTKGKVEREIRYLKTSFFPGLRIEGIDVSAVRTEKLNELVLSWLKRVDGKILRELGQSRLERFKQDYQSLQAIVAKEYDHRITEPLKVSREAKITFHTNHYSVDASYRGKMLEGKYDPDTKTMTLYFEGKEIKSIDLLAKGARKEIVDGKDRQSLYKAWYEDRERYERQMRLRVEKKKHRAELDNVVVHPSVFDHVFGIETEQGKEAIA